MATAADSSSPYSPRVRLGAAHNLSPPWSHIVRGELEAAALAPSDPPFPSPPPEPSDRSPLTAAEVAPADAAGAPPPTSDGAELGGGGGGGVAAPSREKKSAWSRPSNGVVEAGAVMGAASWPALSEAAKPPTKSSSYDSLKGLPNGSVAASPAPGTTSPPPKSTSSNASSSSSANHAAPALQKSMKRGGGSSENGTISNTSGDASANGGPMMPKMQPSSAEASYGALDKLVNSEPSPRELPSRSGNWDHGSSVGGLSTYALGGSEHQKNHGNSRRGNSSAGGGGHHHNNFGNRPDQERGGGGYDRNHRSFGGGRDVQVQQQQQQQPRAMTRPFLRPPPPGSAPFVAPPPPVRPFVNPMGYHDIPSPLFYVPTPPPPESFRGMPFVAPPAMFLAPLDLQLRGVILKQIEYYFSSENLCKDVYLRQNMDEEGWVPISLIAGFNRVRNLTNNIQFILDTVRTSAIVEVQGDKMRRRNDWKNWPPLTQPPNSPNSSTMPTYDALAARLTHIRMEEGSTSQNSIRGVTRTEAVLNRSSSADFNSQSQVAAFTGNRSVHSNIRNSSERSVSARSLDRSDTF